MIMSAHNKLRVESEKDGTIWIRDRQDFYLMGKFSLEDGLVMCTGLPKYYEVNSRGQLKITGVDGL